MSNVLIPSYLTLKLLPTNKSNLISDLKEIYGWKTYGDISESQLENVYNQDFDKFWTLIKYLTFQGFKFKGKLNRYNFSSGNGRGYNLYLNKQEQGAVLDYEYTYAFLKLQLTPNGIYDKYDLHLLPLDHVINENLNVDRAKSFFDREGFTILETESLSNDEKFSTLSNNKSEELSTEKNLIFRVGDTSYTMPGEKADTILNPDNLPSSRILHTLIGHGYKKVKDLPSDLSFLLELPQIGTKSVLKFLQRINDNKDNSSKTKASSARGNAITYTTILEKGSLLYLEDEFPFNEEWMQMPILKDKIDENLYKLFMKYEFKTLGELPADIEAFLRSNGFKKVESRELSLEVFNLLPIQGLKELLSRTLEYFVNKEKPKFLTQRDWEMVYHRADGKTLEEVGEMFDVTRERVRQIVKKSLNAMFKQYTRYFLDIKDNIGKNLFLNIHSLFNDDEAQVMKSIVEVHSFPFGIYNDYLYIGNRNDFLKIIDKLKSDIKTKRNDTHIYTREEIEEYVVSFISENATKEQDVNVDAEQVESLTNDLIHESFDPINVPNHYLYKQKLTKARMCQLVFEAEFSDGLYVYKEIDLFVEKLLKYFPEEFKNDSHRSIIANLTRDENVIVLWKVGYFKHISAVHPDVNATNLAPIKDWLQTQLSENTIQINTNLAYAEFGDELERLEIDSEHALFSLLKIYFPDAFNYSRSPTLVMVGHERLEKKKVLENYLKNQSGYVSNDTINRHFIHNLGWTRTMLEQNVSASEYLIKTSDGLIHIDCLDIGQEALKSIFKYVKNKINQLQNSFSIETVFEERKSTLLQMNIKDSRVLYHLLEKYYPEEFDFYRYPSIHPAGKYKEDQLSVVGQFETFFLEEDDFFLRDELYEEFVEERGWAMSTYYMAYRKTRDIIFEVYPEEFAHINLIEWTMEKAEKLFEVLDDFLQNRNKPFVHIEREIIPNDHLIDQFPEINPLFDWNHTLLTSILQNTDQFVLLGTKKVGILSKKNSYGIQNEHDFIAYLLKNKFNGYVKVKELQKYLYRIDMCNDTIPKYYLTSEDKELDYQVVNDEVILKELVVGK